MRQPLSWRARRSGSADPAGRAKRSPTNLEPKPSGTRNPDPTDLKPMNLKPTNLKPTNLKPTFLTILMDPLRATFPRAAAMIEPHVDMLRKSISFALVGVVNA